MHDGRHARTPFGARTAARRLGAAAAAIVVLLVVAGCSGGASGADQASRNGGVRDVRTTCALIDRLGRSASRVAAAPVADPDRFEAAVSAAVAQYVATLDAIARQASGRLRRDVELLRSAVQQREFADAIEARAPLDDWAAERCNGGQ